MPNLLALILPIALGPASPVFQASYPNYGLTDSQVLAMGRDRYREFHESKAGTSTAAMVECEVIYGQVLFRRNTRLSNGLPKAAKVRLETLRRELGLYSGSLIEVSASFSGGGTMWSPVRSAVSADVEEVVYHLLVAKPKKAPARVVSDVSKLLANLRSAIEKEKIELEIYRGSGYGYVVARDSLVAASNAFGRVAAACKGLPRNQSDIVLEWCRLEAAASLGEARTE